MTQEFDFVIVATGFVTDLSLRPELGNLHDKILLWRDRYTPPAEDANEDLGRHPYLGPNFQMQEKVPGTAPYMSSIFNYTFGCLPSLGFGGASISGLKYSLPVDNPVMGDGRFRDGTPFVAGMKVDEGGRVLIKELESRVEMLWSTLRDRSRS